jgi:hypothetical protein
LYSAVCYFQGPCPVLRYRARNCILTNCFQFVNTIFRSPRVYFRPSPLRLSRVIAGTESYITIHVSALSTVLITCIFWRHRGVNIRFLRTLFGFLQPSQGSNLQRPSEERSNIVPNRSVLVNTQL